ncbi:hypothetical protein WJX74_000704 [Apatococcus lobatus]|uniref:Uncharacterized protein n=1 Tax=Apatococcus lobatus TaxID=904363 RepID=A0AAW1RVA1_9CHLO
MVSFGTVHVGGVHSRQAPWPTKDMIIKDRAGHAAAQHSMASCCNSGLNAIVMAIANGFRLLWVAVQT